MASERFNFWAARLIFGSVILGGALPSLGADPSAVTGAEAQPNTKQVQTSPVPPSDKSKVFGVKPVEVQIHWTAYYVVPVEKETTQGKGHAVLAVDRQGKEVHVVLTTSSYNAANMEAVVVGIDKQGRKRYVYRVKNDVWYELPEGVEAMGNQTDA